jgi:hypothetical protein
MSATLFEGVIKGEAVFDGEEYRYQLSRVWNPELGRVAWIMCNPSTADAEVLDPTVNRCLGFTSRFGFGGFDVVNIFALRSTDPAPLNTHADPIGPQNDNWILEVATRMSTKRVICAWGEVGGKFTERAKDVIEMLRAHGVELWCLGTTKAGHPRHPLYVKGSQELVRFA